MLDPKDKPKPCYAPVYAAIYPELSQMARDHGYALAIHGSLRRDFDLIAIPWIEDPKSPEDFVKSITTEFSINVVDGPNEKLHGRIAWTISVGFGQCAIDLSFMSRRDNELPQM